jgi:hypothetical protein
MANLVIRPASGTGNKVVVQDQAGGAVLTTADSGATMASNVTGIPAAGVTGVLPVGVTGGSGLTALGTIASGNLSNSAIIYPVGHIVQTVYLNYPGNSGNTGSTSWVVAGDLSITIDPIFTNSIIEVDWYVSSTHYNKGNGNCKGYWILRNVTQGHYIPGSRLETFYAGGSSYLYSPTHGQGHEVLSTGASQTYTVYVKAGGGTFYWANPSTGSFGTGAEDSGMRMIAREIKQ